MPYCTVDEVKAAVDFPDTGAPISDADIQEFIFDAQDGALLEGFTQARHVLVIGHHRVHGFGRGVDVLQAQDTF